MARVPKTPDGFDQRGTVAIEYAFVLPVLLLLLLGIFDTGRLLWTYATLHRAGEAAARCAAIKSASCSNFANAQSYAVTQAWGLSIDASAFTVSNQTCGVQVTASYVYSFAIPWLFGLNNSTTLTATACYPA
jgi:Flp pilus assembly protein TadG